MSRLSAGRIIRTSYHIFAEKGELTLQLEQEQELQLPEQQLQEQGDMMNIVLRI